MLSLDEDNRHENRVLQYLSERWDANYVLAHQKKGLFDGFLHRPEAPKWENPNETLYDGIDRPVAYVEVRKRYVTRLKYPTIMISYTKVKGWHEIAPVMNIPCLFVVNYKDCLAYCSLEDVFLENDIRVSPKSPNRRNPLDDQEIVFHYPTSKLKVIADGDKSTKH